MHYYMNISFKKAEKSKEQFSVLTHTHTQHKLWKEYKVLNNPDKGQISANWLDVIIYSWFLILTNNACLPIPTSPTGPMQTVSHEMLLTMKAIQTHSRVKPLLLQVHSLVTFQSCSHKAPASSKYHPSTAALFPFFYITITVLQPLFMWQGASLHPSLSLLGDISNRCTAPKWAQSSSWYLNDSGSRALIISLFWVIWVLWM